MRKMVHRKVAQSKTVATEVGVFVVRCESMMPVMFAELLWVVVGCCAASACRAGGETVDDRENFINTNRSSTLYQYHVPYSGSRE
jgi:hypothetical protein